MSGEASLLMAGVTERPQRISGIGRVTARFSGGKTRLEGLYQEGAAKIRLPESVDGVMEAVLINNAGGLTGGDRLQWELEAGAGTMLTATTQACEKIYRSEGGPATIDTELRVGENARLDWLPQETILFDEASLTRRLDVDLAETAAFLAIEAVLLGRKAVGEAVRCGTLRDRWRVRRCGRLVHAEDVRMTGDIEALVAQAAVLGGDVAFATLLYCGPRAELFLPKVREVLGEAAGGRARGATSWYAVLSRRMAML